MKRDIVNFSEYLNEELYSGDPRHDPVWIDGKDGCLCFDAGEEDGDYVIETNLDELSKYLKKQLTPEQLDHLGNSLITGRG